MEGPAVAGDGTAVKAGPRRAMRLHLVRGSFCCTDEAGARMSAQVWSKLPAELMWEVVLRWPTATHFQLQVVSRKWQQVLTSAKFRDRWLAAEAGRAGSREEEQQQRVVACVDVADGGQGSCCCPYCQSINSSQLKPKVLDIDLSRFVPDRFWASDSYSVVAAGDGLVCIFNDSKQLPHYCLLNPLTRTCVVLPPLPFVAKVWHLPGIAGGVTICGWSGTSWDMATYYHGTGGGSGGGVWAVTRNPPPHGLRVPAPFAAVLGARTSAQTLTYRYDLADHKVHVLAPLAGPGNGDYQVEVCALDSPGSLDAYDVPPSTPADAWREWQRDKYSGHRAAVVAHRGAIYLVQQLVSTDSPLGRACCVWVLLAGDDELVAWEPVAFLDGQALRHLTDFSGIDDALIRLEDVYAVRELLCCHVSTRAPGPSRGWLRWLLGFDLDTGMWELVPGVQNLRSYGLVFDRDACRSELVPRGQNLRPHSLAKVMELRPDLVVS